MEVDNMGKKKSYPDVKAALFNSLPTTPPYPENSVWQSHLLEQYKLYVQTTDKISDRRHLANTFFLTMNTGLIALFGYSFPKDNLNVWMLGLMGASTCFLWFRLLASYRTINDAKFRVVNEIETQLPIRPFHAEWFATGNGEAPELHKPFSKTEAIIPLVFLAAYIFILFNAINFESIYERIINCYYFYKQAYLTGA